MQQSGTKQHSSCKVRYYYVDNKLKHVEQAEQVALAKCLVVSFALCNLIGLNY